MTNGIMSKDTKPFWESVKSLAYLRDKIPEERRELSGVRRAVQEDVLLIKND
jgi:hypothetical protein